MLSNRMLFAGVAFVALAAGGVESRTLAQSTPFPAKEAGCCQDAKSKLVRHVYPIADLIIPAENAASMHELSCTQKVEGRSTTPFTSCAAMTPEPARANPMAPRASDKSHGTERTLEDRLIKLITHTIASETWDVVGGSATLEYYPIGMALVVNQTAEVHEQITELLAELRRLQDVEVSVEIRLVSVADDLFQRLCENMPGLVKEQQCPAYGAGPVRPVFLDERQVSRIMEAVQGDRGTAVTQAPKITMFDGQTSGCRIINHQCFVTGLETVKRDGQTLFMPRIENIATGLEISVQPAVSGDRRFVHLNLKAIQKELEATKVPQLPVTTFVQPVFEGGAVGQPVPFTQFLQQPQFTTLALEKSVNVPDGGTVLLAGWKRPAENDSEPCPFCSIPILGKLFEKPSQAPEVEHVLVMVTPRIITNEQKGTGAGCECPVSKTVAQAAPAKQGVAEEQEVMPPPAASEKVPSPVDLGKHREKVAKLLKKYHKACSQGRLSDAEAFARQALALDPACFNREASGKVDRGAAQTPDTSEDLRRIPYEWERIWYTDQPSHLTPERVQGGIR